MIIQALEEAEYDDEFFHTMLSCFEDASITCGDRIALSLIYLDINLQKHQVKKTQNYPQLARLIVYGTWIIEKLHEIAREKIRTLPDEAEAVETYLVYLTEIKRSINIVPFHIDVMHYPKLSQVTDKEIAQARDTLKHTLNDNRKIHEILVKDNMWEALLKRLPTFHSIEEERTRRTELMTELNGTIGDLDLGISPQEIEALYSSKQGARSEQKHCWLDANKSLANLTSKEYDFLYSKIQQAYSSHLADISSQFLKEDLTL